MRKTEEAIGEEIWKDIEGYKGSYKISNLGRIKSLDRKDANSHRIKGRFLKLKNCKGYATIILCKNGIPKDYRVNRLVAITFLSNPNMYPQVNHKNENLTDNNVDNLEWCTGKYNSNYGTRTERCICNTNYKLIGEKLKNKNGKELYQYSLDKKLIKIYPSIREAVRDGFDKGAISRCFRHKVNMHKGYIFSLCKLENEGVE